MQLSTRIPKRRTRRSRRASAGANPAPARAAEPPEVRAARRGGGPEDHAPYACMCGFAFTAAVTTSVGCPHCGTEQAW
jgi:hypothetical protein